MCVINRIVVVKSEERDEQRAAVEALSLSVQKLEEALSIQKKDFETAMSDAMRRQEVGLSSFISRLC